MQNRLYAQTYYPLNSSFTADLPMVRESLQRTNGPLLDLGCACGKRVLSPFLQEGYTAYGVDIDPQMIEVAKRNLTRFDPKKVNLIHADMSCVIVPENIGTVTCLYNTLPQILDPEKRFKVLLNSGNLLKVGGEILIAIKNDNLLGYDEHGSRTRQVKTDTHLGEASFEISWTADIEKKLKTYKVVIQIGEQKETVIIPTQLISAEEFIKAAKSAGLKLVALHGDYNETHYDQKFSPWQIYRFKKH